MSGPSQNWWNSRLENCTPNRRTGLEYKKRWWELNCHDESRLPTFYAEKTNKKSFRQIPTWYMICTLCCKSIRSSAILWCKMPMFWRAGMREGGKPLPLAFQYLIFMVWRPCDLNLAMVSSLATKCQHFKLGGLQFHYIKWLKKGHFKFKVLAFWSQWRYLYQIQITRPLCHKNQILKC